MGRRIDLVFVLFLSVAVLAGWLCWKFLAQPLWISAALAVLFAIGLFVATIVIHGCVEWLLKNRQIRR